MSLLLGAGHSFLAVRGVYDISWARHRKLRNEVAVLGGYVGSHRDSTQYPGPDSRDSVSDPKVRPKLECLLQSIYTP